MTSKLGKGLESIIPGFLENNLYEKDPKNIIEVNIESIKTGLYQPRKNFDEEKLKELSESIRQKGIIQPLVVVKGGEDADYILIAGERRYRAAILAELIKVPVVVTNYSHEERLEIALIENLQREDLSAIEEAETYKFLMEKYNLTQDEIAKKFQKSRPYITNILRLLTLSENIKDLVRDNKISSAKARTLLSVEDENFREKLAKDIIKYDLSVKKIEEIIENQKNALNNPEDSEDINVIYQRSQQQKRIEFIHEILKDFNLNKDKYLLRVTDAEAGKGFLKIKFDSQEELKNILSKI